MRAYTLFLTISFAFSFNVQAASVDEDANIYQLFVKYRLDVKNKRPIPVLEKYFSKVDIEKIKKEYRAREYSKTEFKKFYYLWLAAGHIVYKVYGYAVRHNSDCSDTLILNADTFPAYNEKTKKNNFRAIIEINYIKEDSQLKITGKFNINRSIDVFDSIREHKIINDFKTPG